MNKLKKAVLPLVALVVLLALALTACGETDTTEPLTSKLEATYTAGVEVDLAPELAEGWSCTIAIYRGTTPLVSKLSGTKYTFEQSGDYTITYTATKGGEKKTLSVDIKVTAQIGETFVTFEGSEYNLACYDGFVAKFFDKNTNEVKLETTYSYTRSTSVGFSGYENPENAAGPVFYIHYKDKTEANGMPACARSVCTGGDMTLAFSEGDITDNFTLAKTAYTAKFGGKEVLTFNGKDSVFGASSLTLYDDGLCSYSFLGSEVTAGRFLNGDSYVLYGGGSEGNNYGGGVWSMTGTNAGDFAMTLNIDGTKYEVSLDVTNTLMFNYTYSIATYKRVMSMSSPASDWMPALLGIAAEKVVFNGAETKLICYDDEEQTVGVFKSSDTENAIQTGHWTFNDISRTFGITLLQDGAEVKLPVTPDGDRLTVTYTNEAAGINEDKLETSLTWDKVFPEAGVVLIEGTGLFSANIDMSHIQAGAVIPVTDKEFRLTVYNNGTFMLVGSVMSENGHVDTGTYTFRDNVYTFVGNKNKPFTTTFADGVYTTTYLVHYGPTYSYPCEISFAPELVLYGTGGLSDRPTDFVLTAYTGSGYGETYCTVFGSNAATADAHSNTGTFVKNADGSYTFSFKEYGTMTTTGSGADLKLVYPFVSGGEDYPVDLTLAPAIVAAEE